MEKAQQSILRVAKKLEAEGRVIIARAAGRMSLSDLFPRAIPTGPDIQPTSCRTSKTRRCPFSGADLRFEPLEASPSLRN